MIKKVVIVTGASRGIGLATVELLMNSGYEVFALSRSSPKEAGARIHCVKGELSDLIKGKDEELPQWLQQLLGREEIKNASSIALVHNAAVLAKDSVESLKGEELLEILKVNIAAPQELNRQLIPYMKEGSSIIYIGSTLSEKAVKNSFSYVTSKHAFAGMMRATCQDLAGKGIHTALICPGFTDTEMLRGHVGKEAAVIDAIKGMVTFGRLIRPEEIATIVKTAIENPVCNGSIWHAHLGQIGC